MTVWISLDWDFITGDCRKAGHANRCTMNCDGCGDTGVVGRGTIGYGYTDWHNRLKEVEKYLNKDTVIRGYLNDSHGEIYKHLSPGDVVLNYDYHTDNYEDEENYTERVECWNWVNKAINNGILVYNYHSLKDLDKINNFELIFGKLPLFIAWSVPYTRSDLDGQLFRFLMGLNAPIELEGNR